MSITYLIKVLPPKAIALRHLKILISKKIYRIFSDGNQSTVTDIYAISEVPKRGLYSRNVYYLSHKSTSAQNYSAPPSQNPDA